mgnify:CR=1 FL=1
MRAFLFATLVASGLVGCATPTTAPITTPPSPTISESEPTTPQIESITTEEIPIPDALLFDFLVAEFALRQGRYREALDLYQRLAEQVNDVNVSARAARIAQFLGDENAVTTLVQLWFPSVKLVRVFHQKFGIVLGIGKLIVWVQICHIYQ